jgi:RNA recognition motif-containing protein
VDAIKYYFDEEVRLEIAVDIEKEVALTKPLGIAFITFRSQSHATAMVNEYSFFSTVCGKRPMSKLSSKLKGSRWHVEYAPVPKDIYW